MNESYLTVLEYFITSGRDSQDEAIKLQKNSEIMEICIYNMYLSFVNITKCSYVIMISTFMDINLYECIFCVQMLTVFFTLG